MEKVYENVTRTWVSELIHLKEYFSRFSSSVPIFEENVNEQNLTEAEKIGRAMKSPLSRAELKILEETCSVNKLTVQDEPPRVDAKIVKTKPGLYEKSKIPKAALNLETIKHLRQRSTTEDTLKHLKYKSNVWPSVELNLEPDLQVGKHILLSVRVYHPFPYIPGVRTSHPRCSQEMMVLGDQTMDVLRDKITCSSDLAVSGELSENPDQVFEKRAKDVYKSGFIFIENTFYNDRRDPKNIDYSEVIRKWAIDHKIGPFNTAVMEKTKFEDLTLRLGYPYVYQHQGNCEHLVVFGDARLLHSSDVLSTGYYPAIRSMNTRNAQYCMICGLHVARWITCENERLPHDPCYLCEPCFRSYNYIDGKKVGNFKAFPYFGKP